MQLLNEFSKSMTFSKVKICMCVFTETLKSTWSTSWTRITFENARIVFLHTNNCHDPQYLLATYDAIFVKNILRIVETHCVPHHHGHNAVAMKPLSLTFSIFKKATEPLLPILSSGLTGVDDGYKKSKASNNTH